MVETSTREKTKRQPTGEEKHRAILQNIEDGYYEVDLAGNFTFVNPALSEIFGYTIDEMLGKNYRHYIDSDSAQEVFQTFNRVYRTGEPTKAFDWKFIQKDGDKRFIEVSVSLARDSAGQPVGFRGIVRDVTHNKEVEKERERLLATLEQRSTQLQTAAEVSRAVSGILEPETLFPQVVDLVRERFKLYYVGLFLVDQTGDWTGEPNKWAVLQAGTGEASREMLKQGHKLEIGGSSMIGWCIANKQPRIALDVGQDAVRFDNPLLPETRSELALPLISRGRALGALSIQSSQEAAFSDEDITVFQTMADQLANAIANANLFEEARNRAERIAVVNRVARAVGTTIQLDDLMQTVYQEISSVFDADAFFIAFYDEEANELDLRFRVDEGVREPAERIPLGTGLTSIVVTEKKPLLVRDLAQRQDLLPVARTWGTMKPAASWLGVPMLVNEEVVGVISVQSYRPHAWDEEDQLLLSTIADQVAAATERARLYDQAQREISERQQAEEALRKAHAELAKYTDNLERRTAQLQVGAEVAREAASILDVQRLLDTAVHLISYRFGFYHAGAFLVDEPGEYAVLRAASSEGGKRMLERGHKLEVGKVGLVGYVAQTGEPRIALDVGKDAVFFDNPDLPETRSEMALPLKIRGRTIGVLDVQSTQEAAFSEDDVAVLQTLADQLAVAIDNARLVERAETQVRELSLLYGEYRAATWSELASPKRSVGYVYDRIDVMPTDRLPTPVVDTALERGETVLHVEPGTTTDAVKRTLATPLKLHDKIIGTIGVQETDGDQEWTPHEIALIEAVSEQVALALENAQHFAETQRSAQQMRILNELARALVTRLTVEEVLEETYWGASRLLDTSSFYVALYDPEANMVSFPLAVERGEKVQWQARPMGEGLTEYVISSRKPLLIKDNVPQRLEELGVALMGVTSLSWLGVPLMIGDRVLGAMAVQSYTTPGAYDEHDRELLVAIASQTAIALQNARLFEQIQQRAQQQRQIYEITSKIRRSPDAAAILQTTVEELGRALQASRAMVRLAVKPREEPETPAEAEIGRRETGRLEGEG